MDITILFKACVKTVKTTNKQLAAGPDTKSYSIKTHYNRDANLRTAKDIVKHISSLQKFFMDNKVAYLNVVNYLSTNKTMTEVDRMEIDAEAQKIINTCSTMIGEYKMHIARLKLVDQQDVHYRNVIQSLERYLKNVSKVYTEAKAVRVKKVIEMHKISKLESMVKKTNVEQHQQNQIQQIGGGNSSSNSSVVENELSPEEMQMFESENDLMYNELNSLSDEVKQMESKVVHIAELQELFTEKVLEQEKDIDRIANVVQATTDNMKVANEQIRQAIQRNAGLRVWVLFFLLVMSFSLLFLDWYND